MNEELLTWVKETTQSEIRRVKRYLNSVTEEDKQSKVKYDSWVQQTGYASGLGFVMHLLGAIRLREKQ